MEEAQQNLQAQLDLRRGAVVRRQARDHALRGRRRGLHRPSRRGYGRIGRVRSRGRQRGPARAGGGGVTARLTGGAAAARILRLRTSQCMRSAPGDSEEQMMESGK